MKASLRLLNQVQQSAVSLAAGVPQMGSPLATSQTTRLLSSRPPRVRRNSGTRRGNGGRGGGRGGGGGQATRTIVRRKAQALYVDLVQDEAVEQLALAGDGVGVAHGGLKVPHDRVGLAVPRVRADGLAAAIARRWATEQLAGCARAARRGAGGRGTRSAL